MKQDVNPRNPPVQESHSTEHRGHSYAIKDQDSFAVLGRRGDINARSGGQQGFYHCGTRFMSRLVLEIGGRRAIYLHATVSTGSAALVLDLTNDTIRGPDGDVVIDRGELHLLRSIVIDRSVYYERLEVESYARRRSRVQLAWQFDSDFADEFEIRGVPRTRGGAREAPRTGSGDVRFEYRGADDVARRATYAFFPPPDEIAADRVGYFLDIAPRGRVAVEIHVSAAVDGAGITPSSYERATAEILARPTHARQACRVTSSSELFDRWLRRADADLAMMTTDLPEGAVTYAGVPWFAALFGRDGLITALETLWCDPARAAGTLRALAALQARDDDPARAAEPGKILHERRHGEMARSGEVPFAAYYGAVDATPLFVVVLDEYVRVTGDRALAAELWPNVDGALRWVEAREDGSPTGFVDHPRPRAGLVNQGWKDSPDAIVRADGSEPEGPIALCEVQGLAYRAYLAGARLAGIASDGVPAQPGQRERWRRRADDLRARFEDRFWLDSLSVYALALSPGGACEVRSSNAGQCLLSGLPSPDRAARIAGALFEDDLFSGWGVRTLSAREVGYNPMSYHRGSVWPHDNALIAWGLSRYGFTAEAARILDAMFAASSCFPLHRLPELFCGFPRREGHGPTPYPSACSPQAWSAGAPYLLLAAALGLELDADSGKVWFRRPALPAGVDELELVGLRVGRASMDLSIYEHRGAVAITVRRLDGRAEVIIVP